MAGQEWANGSPSSFQPDVTPAEKWAVYAIHPQYHKLVGNLSACLTDALGYGATATYICTKHQLSEPKLNHVNTLAQQCFLEKLRIVKQANIVKLIHGSIPTMASLLSQGQVTSPLCPRCLLSVETTQHILPCPYPQAIEC